MDYEELIQHFENGESIYFKKNEKENWNLVTKKEQLFSIHGYIYEVKTNISNDQKIDNLIEFIKLQQGSFADKDSDFDNGKEEGWNEALENVLEYIKNNFHK